MVGKVWQNSWHQEPEAETSHTKGTKRQSQTRKRDLAVNLKPGPRGAEAPLLKVPRLLTLSFVAGYHYLPSVQVIHFLFFFFLKLGHTLFFLP